MRFLFCLGLALSFVFGMASIGRAQSAAQRDDRHGNFEFFLGYADTDGVNSFAFGGALTIKLVKLGDSVRLGLRPEFALENGDFIDVVDVEVLTGSGSLELAFEAGQGEIEPYFSIGAGWMRLRQSVPGASAKFDGLTITTGMGIRFFVADRIYLGPSIAYFSASLSGEGFSNVELEDTRLAALAGVAF